MRAWIGLIVLASCGGTPSVLDGGGMDAGSREDAASLPDAGTDAPMAICTPACDETQTCCDDGAGPVCQSTYRDPTHCGNCDTDCLASNRGERCDFGFCTCNGVACQGEHDSFCCPPLVPGGTYYCADLDHATGNCGECGRGCDLTISDHCDGGLCYCGDTRRECDGGPTSQCCGIGAGAFDCIDTTNNINNCGTCGLGCIAGERCESSTCTRGASCDGGCTLGEICCAGSCCARTRCVADTCI
jgi:hypothetical protein